MKLWVAPRAHYVIPGDFFPAADQPRSLDGPTTDSMLYAAYVLLLTYYFRAEQHIILSFKPLPVLSLNSWLACMVAGNSLLPVVWTT